MRHLNQKVGIAILSAIALASCVDNKYDLSDIDTTVQVSVNDLVIPVNIDEIRMSSIISTTKDIQVVDGAYAYVTDGTFSSDPININPFNVTIKPIKDVKVALAEVGSPAPGYDVTYSISDMKSSDFSFHADHVSKDINSLTKAYADAVITMGIDFSALKPVTDVVRIANVQVQLPKHLVVDPVSEGVYDPATGVFLINQLDCSSSARQEIRLAAKAIDIAEGEFDPQTRGLDIVGQLGMLAGDFSLKTTAGNVKVEQCDIYLQASISNFSVSSIDGSIQYDIDNVRIPTVNLNSIPGFLDKPGTSLSFANPCLYLSTTNPLQEYDIIARTGLEITANRPGQVSKTFTTDKPYFTIGDAVPDGAKFQFCLSPKMPATLDAAFAKAVHVPFAQLSDVLMGDGLPKTIDVALVQPQIPEQRVEKFRLGVSYPGVDGNYKFIAPFDLNKGSQIVYSDIEDGWSDDDLDKFTITHLEVSFEVTTDIPVGVTLSGYPLGKDGKRMQGVSISSAEIGANANAQPVKIVVDGVISGLDGIEFEAVATADGGLLGPDKTIKLAKIRPQVSGYYIDEL